MIRLAGPGGAGKTTAGRALGQRLGITFADLDECFTARCGDISSFLDAHGYRAYAARNVQAYLDIVTSRDDAMVIALSSGFMTYADDIHPEYAEIRRDIAASPSTIVLLPSLDDEACVRETVRRQLTRPFARSAAREEQVIRERFGVYRGLPAAKVETMRSVDAIVDDLINHLSRERLPRQRTA